MRRVSANRPPEPRRTARRHWLEDFGKPFEQPNHVRKPRQTRRRRRHPGIGQVGRLRLPWWTERAPRDSRARRTRLARVGDGTRLLRSIQRVGLVSLAPGSPAAARGGASASRRNGPGRQLLRQAGLRHPWRARSRPPDPADRRLLWRVWEACADRPDDPAGCRLSGVLRGREGRLENDAPDAAQRIRSCPGFEEIHALQPRLLDVADRYCREQRSRLSASSMSASSTRNPASRRRRTLSTEC